MTRETRFGIGYDIHRLEEGTGIFLGGVFIKCKLSVSAHSNGDILIHAVCDALLGAFSMYDIGHHFPPSDVKWRGITGNELVQKVLAIIGDNLDEIINIDCIIKTETPKLAQHQEKIRNSMAKLLELENNRVNVKIKSGEGLGDIGKGKAIEAYAAAAVIRRS